MKREEKQVIIDNLTEQIKAHKHIYISDISELDAAATQGSSAVMLSETGNAPAKLIKEFRKNHDKPVLKAAFVEECAYVGENQLDALVSIKSKEELLGDIVLLLQSPMQKLISALESGKNTIGGVLKTLEDRA